VEEGSGGKYELRERASRAVNLKLLSEFTIKINCVDIHTSCDLPTKHDSSPNATTVSVALGSRLTTRRGVRAILTQAMSTP